PVELEEKPYFHVPPNGHKIPIELHVQNRKRLVEALRDTIAAHPTYKTVPLEQFVILLQAGTDVTRGGSDSEVLFRQNSYFHWAFGTPEPDWFGSINLATAKSCIFVPEYPESFSVSMGEIDSNQEIREKFLVDEVHYVHKIAAALNGSTLLLLKGLNTDSGNLTEPASFDGIDKFKVDYDVLHPVMAECRVLKTPLELDVMRYANKASSSAHRALMRALYKPEKEPFFQYHAESLFLHHCYYEWGMRHVSYTCIGASGCHCSVLHYGHAGKPNDQPIKTGDMCLFDMGGEYHCYTSDITCSFPCGGKFSPEQKVVYEAVLKANRAVIAALRPGVSWTEMHLLAEKIILSDLVTCGILKGSLDEMMAERIGAIFQPHGLGHLLGCDTHDVGGYNPVSFLKPKPKLLLELVIDTSLISYRKRRRIKSKELREDEIK
ncbi:hypothetical protein Ciccas_013418, partial [Cichlidogyrus casuarinus]